MSIASSWDAEYRTGRYVGDPPLPFVAKITETLDHYDPDHQWTGLYVGCGNGRNFLPLVDHGLQLIGLDVSAEALRQLSEQRPGIEPDRLICDDFTTFEDNGRKFDYLVALQVFQHGNAAQVSSYFSRVAQVLRPGGLFFLRVNSVSTEIVRQHSVVERDGAGGLTVRYDDGPKEALLIHFFSRLEIAERLEADFHPIVHVTEDVTHRAPPLSGTWSQWEGVWQRR